MILSNYKYGRTNWKLLRFGNRYTLKIETPQGDYIYPLQYDPRHQRLHPSTDDLLTMETMDLQALNHLARDAFGEHPRSNPAGSSGVLPLLVRRRATSILKKYAEEQGYLTPAQIGMGIGTAKKQLQRTGHLKIGVNELTVAGKRKEKDMEPWKRAEAEQFFSAYVEKPHVDKSRSPGKTKAKTKTKTKTKAKAKKKAKAKSKPKSKPKPKVKTKTGKSKAKPTKASPSRRAYKHNVRSLLKSFG